MEVTSPSLFLFGLASLAIGILFSSLSPLLRRKTSINAAASSSDEEDNNNKPKPKKKKKTMMTKNSKAQLEIEKLADIIEDFKMVLVVRNDLKMGKGKIAAQCSHATLGIYKKLVNRAPKALERWENCGQVKVVLKTESEDDLLVLQERAKSINLSTHVTIDAGRTQIAPNSRTVMAILGRLSFEYMPQILIRV
ncbi:peptidyl-tRNA hydrolase [Ranunculus cassubicifolius]